MSESDTSAATGRDPGLAEAVRFQRDLYLVWQFAAAESGGLPLTGRGYLTRATLRGLRALLAAAEGLSVPATGADVSETEDVRLHFIRRLSQRLGLLRLAPSAGADERSRTTARASEGGRLIAAEREEMARYLDHPLAERLRICARLWVAGGWWPDQPDGRGPPPRVMTPAPPRLAVARRRLLDALAAAVPNAAYPLPPLRAETPAQRRSRAQGRAGAQRLLAAVRVAAQGGDARMVEQPELLPSAPCRVDVSAPRGGFVAAIDAERVGMASVRLGAGRMRKGDPIDHAVGLYLWAKVGDAIDAGEPLLQIHARSPEDARAIRDEVLAAYTFNDEAPTTQPLLLETVTGSASRQSARPANRSRAKATSRR